MSGRARSRSRGRGDGQESSDLFEPVVEMGLEKTEGERGDSPGVKGKTPPTLKPAKIPEAGPDACPWLHSLGPAPAAASRHPPAMPKT
ncbi:P antigen family member 3 [Trichechus manatus latirostris]|uniref:P antigen family member 3 n=1 Tax=Trichechus manatus latirostris TaxID=127582 RepID=A0A2Y9R299_TRIMA|nr:P antigen family member 3 [Trichechus manatus latirostris]